MRVLSCFANCVLMHSQVIITSHRTDEQERNIVYQFIVDAFPDFQLSATEMYIFSVSSRFRIDFMFNICSNVNLLNTHTASC